MCQAFSCLIPKTGNEALWKFGVDSHAELVALFGLSDKAAIPDELKFGRAEITPANGNYLAPDKWVLTIGEPRPSWLGAECKKLAIAAHGAWKRKLYSILVRKPIVHPFLDRKAPRKITKKHLALLDNFKDVRASVGASVRDSVWASVRASVGASVRDSVWASVRASVGDSVWASVGTSVWTSVCAYIGSFFRLPRSEWKYTEKVKSADYPFQSAVDLWEMGLVLSFDGKLWRLHGGKDGKVLWTENPK